ncbi:DUF2142 domain-containing protein [Streptacidiphilus sp. PB12-B1b]|uniref:DUF2142 domain-containing protein n=1 Tax=Streptacidiphilus sp. PB12-B1b TaxID=2705012 RepID=UPI0015FBA1C5|nr:DUF2142 domain-containing protein [Streptacidiphilus sp. PB12-B1b]QMU79341.1 DUF2142 domain-containing protein [Streptacidiphilus sp. PB12-B1b]
MPPLLQAIGPRVTANRRSIWLAGFAFFLTLMAAWSLATPLTAAPDEPAHILRAASVVRGQFNGPPVVQEVKIADFISKEVITGIRLPERYASLNDMFRCYAFNVNRPAGCAPDFHGTEQVASMTTSAGRYNPVYYLAVGWPSLLLNGSDSVYAMRLLTAVLCAALLASAVVTASEWRRRGVAVLGVLAAATPMVLFLGGVVNPNAVECAAGILAWTAVLSVFMSPDPALLNRRLAAAGIASASLFCIRPLGLAWVAATITVGLLVNERGTLPSIIRRRAFWVWTAVSGVAFVAGELWNITHPDHSSLRSALTPEAVAMWTFHASGQYVDQMVGNFGWLNTPVPAVTLLIWLGVIVALALLALTCCRRREALPLLAIAVGIFVIPIAGSTLDYRLGPIWQGRYLLAFAAGLPVLSAFVIARRNPLPGPARRRLVTITALLLAFANLAAFYWALHRYLVGINGALLPRHVHWQPPGTWMLWTAVYGLGLLAQYGLVRAFAQDREPDAGTARTGADGVGAAPGTLGLTRL